MAKCEFVTIPGIEFQQNENHHIGSCMIKFFSKLRKHRQKTNDFYNYVHVISESSYYAFFQLGNLKHVHYYPQNFSTVNDVVYSKIS